MADIALTAAKIAVVDPDKAIIDAYVAGVTITAGQFLYGIVASGKVGLAKEDTSAVTSWVLGMALNGATAGQTVNVLRRGKTYGFTLSGAYWLPLSLSDTAGALRDDYTTNVVARIAPVSDADLTKVLMIDCGLGIVAGAA
jgi:hypothetical protein